MEKMDDDDRVLLGRRIRYLRNMKDLTQQELGHRADVDYKFLGEIERGNMNPSFKVLVNIAAALDVEPAELMKFEHEISDPKEIENRIMKILRTLPPESMRQVLFLLKALFPAKVG